jgi:hypothetical protein
VILRDLIVQSQTHSAVAAEEDHTKWPVSCSKENGMPSDNIDSSLFHDKGGLGIGQYAGKPNLDQK